MWESNNKVTLTSNFAGVSLHTHSTATEDNDHRHTP